MATKLRSHNEYFRIVCIRYPKVRRYREPQLIDEILSRPGNTLTREQLEQPYETLGAPVSSRKSCPACKAKLPDGEFVWSWGEYHNAKWRTVTHFCQNCFPKYVRSQLTGHTTTCGCSVNLIGYSGTQLPEWLTV